MICATAAESGVWAAAELHQGMHPVNACRVLLRFCHTTALLSKKLWGSQDTGIVLGYGLLPAGVPWIHASLLAAFLCRIVLDDINNPQASGIMVKRAM